MAANFWLFVDAILSALFPAVAGHSHEGRANLFLFIFI
jgi:hypothetical protein